MSRYVFYAHVATVGRTFIEIKTTANLMWVFILSCVVAAIIAAGAAVVLDTMQKPSSEVFTGSHPRPPTS